MKPTTQAQRLADLEARATATEVHTAQAEADMRAMKATLEQTNAAVMNLHRALLDPQPGHERNLLNRVASATIEFENGKLTTRVLLGLFGVATAINGFFASMKLWGSG